MLSEEIAGVRKGGGYSRGLYHHYFQCKLNFCLKQMLIAIWGGGRQPRRVQLFKIKCLFVNIVKCNDRGLVIKHGLFTLSVSRTPEPGPEKMGCMKLCRIFHIRQGQGPHCFLLSLSLSRSRFRSRSKPV